MRPGRRDVVEGKPSEPSIGWPTNTRLRIFARDIRRHDAVGNFCFQLADMARGAGIPVILNAENFDQGDQGFIEPVKKGLADAAGDVLFVNFSTEDPALEQLAALDCPKILYFHGITPAHFFAKTSPRAAQVLSNGYAQLPLAKGFDVLMANSHATANTLRDVVRGQLSISEDVIVAPPVVDLRRWDKVADEPLDLPCRSRLLLFVGRIAPNKGILPLIRAFRRLAAVDDAWALVLVGATADEAYGQFVSAELELQEDALEGRISLMNGISDGALKSAYQRADIFVTLSEHEGFCIPLIEAMKFDIPIVAASEPAISEILGNAGLVIGDRDEATVVDAILRIQTDKGLAETLRRNRNQRLIQISELADGSLIRMALEQALIRHACSI